MFRPTLPRRLHRAVLRLLCPAEAAVRRLILVVARGLVAQPPPPRPRRRPKPASIFLRRGSIGTGILMPPGAPSKPPRPAPRAIALPLSDRVKRPFERRRPAQICVPRISCPGPFATLSPIKLRRLPEPDDPLDATRLTLRIRALAAALDDLPAQANRFARWRARRDAEGTQEQDRDAEGAQSKMRVSAGAAPIKPGQRRRRVSPLRPGRPPGLTRRLESDMHGLLTDLHGLAFDVIEHPDTS